MDAGLRLLTVPPELALEFFSVFSRLEYALKITAQFRQAGNGEAKADWAAFAEGIAQSFEPHKNQETKRAFEFLVHANLRRLEVSGNDVEWKPFNVADPESDADRVIRIIKQVRNNLFHGGKYAREPDGSPERDRALLLHSLTILRYLVGLHAEVQAKYEM